MAHGIVDYEMGRRLSTSGPNPPTGTGTLRMELNRWASCDASSIQALQFRGSAAYPQTPPLLLVRS